MNKSYSASAFNTAFAYSTLLAVDLKASLGKFATCQVRICVLVFIS